QRFEQFGEPREHEGEHRNQHVDRNHQEQAGIDHGPDDLAADVELALHEAGHAVEHGGEVAAGFAGFNHAADDRVEVDWVLGHRFGKGHALLDAAMDVGKDILPRAGFDLSLERFERLRERDASGDEHVELAGKHGKAFEALAAADAPDAGLGGATGPDD